MNCSGGGIKEAELEEAKLGNRMREGHLQLPRKNGEAGKDGGIFISPSIFTGMMNSHTDGCYFTCSLGFDTWKMIGKVI